MDKNDLLFKIETLSETSEGVNFKISLKIPLDYGWIYEPTMVVKRVCDERSFTLKHISNDELYAYFENEIFLDTYAIYKYYFTFKVNNQKYFLDSFGNITLKPIKDSQMNKLSVKYAVPDWAKGQIMYHIFVDRFYRGSKKNLETMARRHIHNSWDEDVVVNVDGDGIPNNDFYGGDLLGIIDKLEYIKSLGTGIIYLSPVFYSQSTHRYDTSNYEMIDPYAGTNEDLKLLCQKAHSMGMKIILDAVFNHTGSDSIYFNKFNSFDSLGAYQSLDSKYLPFYMYKMVNGQPQFSYWWGFDNLPECNCDGLEWQSYIVAPGGIIDKWFSMGIDGLRLDVPDVYSDSFNELIRQAVLRNKKDGLIIGEIWYNPIRCGRNFLAGGKAMDSVMNYNLAISLINYFRHGSAGELATKINELINDYPLDALLAGMNFTSTHDFTRGINLWDNDIFEPYGEYPWTLKEKNHENLRHYRLKGNFYEKARNIFEAYVYALAFMPGILSIFYGDEIGMQGLGNLLNRRPFTWNCIDNNLLAFFKSIGKIREQEEFLRFANWELLDVNEKYLAFERYSNLKKAFIAINRTDEVVDINIPKTYQDLTPKFVLKRSRTKQLDAYGGIYIPRE